MGFNKRKMEAQRAAAAEKEVAAKRATEAQILEDAGRLLIPALSCRSCRPSAPFAELVRLSDKSVADGLHEQHTRRVLGD